MLTKEDVIFELLCSFNSHGKYQSDNITYAENQYKELFYKGIIKEDIKNNVIFTNIGQRGGKM